MYKDPTGNVKLEFFNRKQKFFVNSHLSFFFEIEYPITYDR